MKDGIESNWDDVNFETECEVIAVINGEDNEDCEKKANEEYSDFEIYGYTYNDDIEKSDEYVEI